MPRIKTETGRYQDGHAYMKAEQDRMNALSANVTPATIQWETAEIKRFYGKNDPKTGPAKRVQIFRNGICTYDSYDAN